MIIFVLAGVVEDWESKLHYASSRDLPATRLLRPALQQEISLWKLWRYSEHPAA